MKDVPSFLSVAHVIAVHRRMIAEFGGDAEIRDRGLLESAVAMPAAQFGGEFLHEDLAAMAAAYLFHLVKNHPFVDGNKRTALAAAEVFLLVNHLRLDATNSELEKLTMGAAKGGLSKDDVIRFFQERTKGH